MTQQVIIERRRRSWPKDEKRRIVEETFDPNVTVTEIVDRLPISRAIARWNFPLHTEKRRSPDEAFKIY